MKVLPPVYQHGDFVAAFSVRGSSVLVVVAVECRRVATSGACLWNCSIDL
jgi:hypothetical protein